MIELIYGLPGDGKSLTGMGVVIHWLKNTKFYVNTNIPITSLGAVAEYLDGKSPWGVDVASRLRLLSDVEVLRFWRHLAPGLDFNETRPIKLPSADAEYRVLQVPNYDRLSNDWPGSLFVLDEAHIPFSAYNYADISDEMTWAVSQHRHLGIEVVLLSQHPEKIAKALRRDIHKFTRVRNYGNRRTFGFVMPGRFRRITYPELPTRGNSEQVVDEAGWFTLDKEIAKLYNTNAGTGIMAKTFGVERKAKGFRLWNLAWMFPLFLVACVGLSMGLVWAANSIPHAVMRMGGVATKGVSGMAGLSTGHPVTNRLVATPPALPAVPYSVVAPTNPPARVVERLYWVARYNFGDNWHLVLSDGRRLVLGGSSGWTGFSGDVCYVDGQPVYPVQKVDNQRVELPRMF